MTGRAPGCEGGVLMSITVLIRTAWKALQRNVSRSLLTMLGIIIGVGAVIASMAIGAGAQAAVLKQIESLGANLIVITPGSITSGGVSLGSGSRTTLKLDDIDCHRRQRPGDRRCGPLLPDQRPGGGRLGQLVHGDRRNNPGTGSPSATGTSPRGRFSRSRTWTAWPRLPCWGARLPPTCSRPGGLSAAPS